MKLWKDESGAVLSAELVLLLALVVVAMVVGMKELQRAVVEELEDAASAIGAISQTYSVGGVSGTCASASGFAYTDGSDAADADTDVNACVAADTLE